MEETLNITPAPQFTPPSVTPTPPAMVVCLSTTAVPVPRLMDMRRDLISALQTVENMLCLPPERRALRTREERRNPPMEKKE